MAKPKTPAVLQTGTVERARMMAKAAGPMLASLAAKTQADRWSIDAMVEGLTLIVDREEARNPPKRIDDSLTVLDKVRAVARQILAASHEIGQHAYAVAFWAREIEPLSVKVQRTKGGRRHG